TQADLVVATMDLSVVRMVRQAIRVADLSSQRGCDTFECRGIIEHRRHFHPEPVIEPRRHIHPEPVYERRPVIRPHPRVEQQMLVCPCESQAPAPPMQLNNPIQPPWRTLPWTNPPQPRQTVKVHLHRTDVICKGSVLDLFV